MTPRSPADVAVVGGGAAGLACAAALAERGRRVVLLEARGHFGGRAASWIDPRMGAEIDNGPHLLAGAYREFLAFLRRVGASETWRNPPRLRVPLWSSRARHVLEWRRAPGMLGLAFGFLGFRALSPAAAWRALAVIRAAPRAEGAADLPLADWLTTLGQNAESRRWLWHPLARAVFNEEPAILSTRLFAGVLRRLFGEGARAAALMRPAVGLSRLYVDPATAYLAARGAELCASSPAERVRAGSGGYEVDGRSETFAARSVCLAVPAQAAAHLLGAEVAARIPHLAEAATVDFAPLVTAHLWLKGMAPALAEPFVGFVDGDFAWAFDYGAHGSFRQIALVAPGSRALATEQSHRIIRLARQTLAAHEPGLAERPLHDARVVKEPHAAPSLTPAAVRARPASETPIPGLALAGDATDTGLPATLESAALSGHRAAAALDRYLA